MSTSSDDRTLEQHPLASIEAPADGQRPEGDEGPGQGGLQLMLDWRQVAGWAFIVAGFVALFIGWFGVSGETEVWKQLPYVMSAGLTGAALVAVGAVVLVGYDHWRDRRLMSELFERLDRLEVALGGEFEDLLEHLDSSGRRTSRRSR